MTARWMPWHVRAVRRVHHAARLVAWLCIAVLSGIAIGQCALLTSDDVQEPSR